MLKVFQSLRTPLIIKTVVILVKIPLFITVAIDTIIILMTKLRHQCSQLNSDLYRAIISMNQLNVAVVDRMEILIISF